MSFGRTLIILFIFIVTHIHSYDYPAGKQIQNITSLTDAKGMCLRVSPHLASSIIERGPLRIPGPWKRWKAVRQKGAVSGDSKN